MSEGIKKDWLYWLGALLAILGIIIIAIGAVTYLRVLDAKENFAKITGVITVLHQDPADTTSQIVTIQWEIGGGNYQSTESTTFFRTLDYEQGDQIEILVNTENFNDMLLVAGESQMKDFGWRTLKVGITVLMISIGIWTLKKNRMFGL